MENEISGAMFGGLLVAAFIAWMAFKSMDAKKKRPGGGGGSGGNDSGDGTKDEFRP